MLNIHPKFKLNNRYFSGKDDFLDYIKSCCEDDYDFLNEVLNLEYIKVKTSGSTGQPKHISHSVQSLIKSAEATGQYFNLLSDIKALHCLSSDFIAGKMMWVRALHLGWHLKRVEPTAKPIENIKGVFDFAAMVPLQAQESFDDLYRIKKLIIGGAPLSQVWEQKLTQLDTMVYMTYGMTETITHIAVRQIGVTDVFETLPLVKITQDDKSCLVISVPYISNTTIVTNDVVEIIDDKHFRWLGRHDYVINSGGVKLFPEQIERQLHPFLTKPFLISSVSDNRLGEQMVLVIESDPYDIDLEKLSEKSGLKAYNKPKKILFLDKFPITNNGKIKRSDVKRKINQ